MPLTMEQRVKRGAARRKELERYGMCRDTCGARSAKPHTRCHHCLKKMAIKIKEKRLGK